MFLKNSTRINPFIRRCIYILYIRLTYGEGLFFCFFSTMPITYGFPTRSLTCGEGLFFRFFLVLCQSHTGSQPVRNLNYNTLYMNIDTKYFTKKKILTTYFFFFKRYHVNHPNYYDMHLHHVLVVQNLDQMD